MRIIAERICEAVLWGVAVGCALITGFAWRDANKRERDVALAIPGSRALAPAVHPDSVAASAAYTAEHNPFRLNRRPASATAAVASGEAGATTVARPAILLKGVVGATRAWQAVLEGIPGRSGSVVVTQGDTVGGLRIRRIGRDTVVVQGPDTTWKLTVKRQGP